MKYQICVAVIRMNKLTTLQYFRFFGGKITHVLLRLVIPFYFMSVWKLVRNDQAIYYIQREQLVALKILVGNFIRILIPMTTITVKHSLSKNQLIKMSPYNGFISKEFYFQIF